MKPRSFALLRSRAMGCRWLAGLLAVLLLTTAAPPRPAMAEEVTEYGEILAFVAVLVDLVFSFANGGLAAGIAEAFASVMRELERLSGRAYSDIIDELNAMSNVVGGLESIKGLTIRNAPKNWNDRLDEVLQRARKQRNAVVQRVLAAAALCGNGVLDVSEACDPSVDPNGCYRYEVCSKLCTCRPAFCSEPATP